MKNFTCVQDIGNLKSALDEAFEIKKDRFKYVELGRNKTLMMIFFNSSLRTRLSTQKAALNLGMNVIVLDINQGAWKLETESAVTTCQNIAAYLDSNSIEINLPFLSFRIHGLLPWRLRSPSH